MKRRQHTILQPNMRLGDYMKPLVSAPVEWITFLTLSNVTVSRTELINLSNLANIGVLTIGSGVQTPDVGLEDSVVRAWSRAAADSDAFSLLRVLNLRHQYEITTTVFQYLHGFPSLALFNLDDCCIGPKDRVMATTSGWRYRTGKILNEHLQSLEKVDVTWDSVVHACFHAGSAYGITSMTMTAEGVDAINNLPVLHFTLGTATSYVRLNAAGNYNLHCFERVAQWGPRQDSEPRSPKKPFGTTETSKNQPRKKPMLRASKAQSMGDLFTQFGP